MVASYQVYILEVPHSKGKVPQKGLVVVLHGTEWKPLYNPSKEQAELDRAAAYASGIPHGEPADSTARKVACMWYRHKPTSGK
jgi:hypothetical protein